MREQDYKDESFQYSCPECRPGSTKKKTIKKEQKKAVKRTPKSKSERTKKAKADASKIKRSSPQSIEKTLMHVNPENNPQKHPLPNPLDTPDEESRSHRLSLPDANYLSYSSSQDNESQKGKNGVFENDVNMVEDSPADNNQIQEDSDTYNHEDSKKETPAQSNKSSSGEIKEGRRSNRTRKMKESKPSREKMTKNRKKLKRNHEEYSQQDYRNDRDSVQELTRYRSFKIAKEREDIVETRCLAPKVLQF